MEIDRPIAIAVTFFIIILVFVNLILPEYVKVRELQSEILARELELFNKEDYFKSIASSYGKLLERKDNIKKINTAIPSEASIPSLVYFLENKAKENGLVLREITLGSTRSSSLDEIQEINFSFRTRGSSYLAFRRFLDSLEESSRLIKIEGISFERERGDIYEFNFQIKTYSY